jgi:thiamine-monophosphate kinase
MSQLHEFDIITRFFTRKLQNPQRFPLGIGDDAALISPPPGYDLATSIDTLVEGTHFFPQSQADDIGYKSLAVSLSDLAAMAAQPAAVLLALTLPSADESWLNQFSQGFFHLAEQYQVALIGGNITHGPLAISTVTFGWTPHHQALQRNGAKPGDAIYVTGHLGDAGLALKLLQQQISLPGELHQRFFRPHPRLYAGLALSKIATAAIDISDGLAADLSKLLTASHTGGDIYTSRLPLSAVLRERCSAHEAIQLALTAGEDYELCFTAPADSSTEINQIFANLDCTVHYLGDVCATPGLNIWDAEGQLVKLVRPGYQHF